MPRFDFTWSWSTVIATLTLIFSVGGSCAFVLTTQASLATEVAGLKAADARIERNTQENDSILRQEISEFRVEVREAFRDIQKDIRRSK